MLASLGVAGFILGFALQDSLSNFAAGAMILLYQPFDVGDVVKAGGVSGKVRHLSLVSTTILTFDNQKLIVPNRKIWGDVIRNVTAEETRRVDLVFAVRYQEDVDRALDALRAVAVAEERILSEPAPLIKVNDLSQGRVDLILRPWVKTTDYWGAYWDLNRAVKQRFDAVGISLAVPQREVQLRQDKPTST
jgi:small conductance mechanosensitive channel